MFDAIGRHLPRQQAREIAAVISHELRTPLTAIQEAVALLEGGLAGSVNERQLEFLVLASRNVRRMNRTVDRLVQSVHGPSVSPSPNSAPNPAESSFRSTGQGRLKGAPAMAQPRILLVDDEPDIVRTLEFRLEAAGCTVETASNGGRALDVLRGGRVDLVLADFMMPEMNGIELTRTIKDNPLWFDIPVLLFSANPDPEFRRKAIDIGAEEYLSKTIGAGAIADKALGLVGGTAAAAADAGTGPQLAALARSLAEVLNLAASMEGMPKPAASAIQSAQRIAGELLDVVAGEDRQ